MKLHVVKFLHFLEAKEGKNAPFKLKLINPTLFSFSKNELNIKSSLILSRINITALPDGLRVNKNLYLSGCTLLTSLPKNLQVGESLILKKCTSLKTLPDGLKVGKDLILKKCTSLRTLPIDLMVGEHIELTDCTSLKELPNDLQVSSNLILYGCTSLKSLPNGLQVGWDLDLRNTALAKMYNRDEIRDMIKAKGGYVGGNIII